MACAHEVRPHVNAIGTSIIDTKCKLLRFKAGSQWADGVEASPEEISETPTATEIPITGKEKSLPVITVRTDPTTGDRVEETRENGKLVRLLVQPKNAPAYVLHDANGDGRVDAKDAEGPVQPVYWELFKWD